MALSTPQPPHPPPTLRSPTPKFRPLLKYALILSLLGPPAVWGAIQWDPARKLLKLVKPTQNLLTFTVKSVDLPITVLASGALESASSIRVLSDVEGQVAIISLLPRGAVVKNGDVVVELDSSALKTRRTEQQIVLEQARAALALAKQALQVAESQAESDVKTAELALKFAELDLRKYLDGDYPQELRVAQSNITLAEEELKQAKLRIDYSVELQKLGYLSGGQVDADRLMGIRCEIKKTLAEEEERLLRVFSYQRMKQELESKAEEATRALARVTSLARAAVAQADAKFKAQEATLQLEETKLTLIGEQITKCTMRAPQDGVVVYPIPQEEDPTEMVIKEGANVRERQHVFSLPDTDLLQVNASVHEAMVRQVKAKKKARIWVDAYPDLQLHGVVREVSSLPDPQSWRKSTVRFYPAAITIDEQIEGLRPGMNAKVEIVIKELEDVLAVPIQAVLKSGENGYCYVKTDNTKPELRRLRLGKSNDQFVEVKEGLAANDAVILSPDDLGFPSESPSAVATEKKKTAEQKRLAEENKSPTEKMLAEEKKLTEEKKSPEEKKKKKKSERAG